jgi:hypothetical protein
MSHEQLQTKQAKHFTSASSPTSHRDCTPWNDIPIVPDIGVLTSSDPVAPDKACYDPINNAKGIFGSFWLDHHHEDRESFTRIWSETQPGSQFIPAEKMRLDQTKSPSKKNWVGMFGNTIGIWIFFDLFLIRAFPLDKYKSYPTNNLIIECTLTSTLNGV